MQTFEFLIRATGIDPNTDVFDGSFFEAGLSDATISFVHGLTNIDVSREAASMGDAVGSALNQLATIPRLHILEIDFMA